MQEACYQRKMQIYDRNFQSYVVLAFGLLIHAALFITPVQTFASSEDCLTGKAPCNLGERSYWVLPPDNYDQITPLVPMLYFHGWGRQGNVPVNHKQVGEAARKAGVLLIAPDGLGKSWDFWRPGSRDTDFGLKVLADVERSFAIDRNRLLVSGYSWGASMAWRFACEAGNHVSLLLSISGTLYDQSEECKTGPVSVRHVHGLKDTVMDFPFGPSGEETGPVTLWKRVNKCDTEAAKRSEWKTSQRFTRYSWSDCATGKQISLDVHGGGHWIARGWLEHHLKDLVD